MKLFNHEEKLAKYLADVRYGVLRCRTTEQVSGKISRGLEIISYIFLSLSHLHLISFILLKHGMFMKLEGFLLT